MRNWIFPEYKKSKLLPHELSVKIVLAVSSLAVLMAGCSNSGRLSCGGELAPGDLQRIVDSYDGCGDCLFEEVDSALMQCPSDDPLRLVGFYGAYRVGNYDRAVSYYESLVGDGVVDSFVHADAAYMYRELGMGDEALRSFELAVGNGTDVMLRYELAEQYISAGRYSEAIPSLKLIVNNNRPVIEEGPVQVIGDDAIFDDAALALGRAYIAIGDDESAERAYLEVLSVYPDHAEATKALTELRSGDDRRE